MSGLVLAMSVTACGDDDAADPDARPVPDDASTDAPVPPPDAGPDAMEPQSTHEGTISITEVSVPQASAVGASVLVEFEELGSGTQLLPAYYDIDDSGLVPSGCVVFVHDTEDTPPTLIDEGTVTITGTQTPLGPCSHDSTTGQYLCIYGMHTIAALDSICEHGNAACAGLENPGTASLTIAGASFNAATQAERGMYVNIVGGGFTTQGAFPIVGVLNATTVVIVNPLETGSLQIADAAGAAVIISGAGPVPANPPVNFLDDGTATVTVSKPAGTYIEEIPATNIKSAGQGFAFKPGSDTPMAMPTDGSAAELNCTGPDDTGTCGVEPIGVTLTLINGSTTDTAVTGTPAYYFPDPTDKYATFLCTFPGIDVDVTIPAGAMDAILGNTTGFEHTPTRIQTRVFKMNAIPVANQDGTNSTTIVSGHGIVGFTDVE